MAKWKPGRGESNRDEDYEPGSMGQGGANSNTYKNTQRYAPKGKKRGGRR